MISVSTFWHLEMVQRRAARFVKGRLYGIIRSSIDCPCSYLPANDLCKFTKKMMGSLSLSR